MLAFISVAAAILVSRNVRTETVEIVVSVHDKPLTSMTVQLLHIILRDKLQLGDQNADLQEFIERYPHLKHLQDQFYNLNAGQVFFCCTGLLRHSSLINNQEVKKQNCFTDTQIKDYMAIKWSTSSKTSCKFAATGTSNRWRQIRKSVKQMLRYWVLCVNWWFHHSLTGQETSNQASGWNYTIKWWPMRYE